MSNLGPRLSFPLGGTRWVNAPHYLSSCIPFLGTMNDEFKEKLLFVFVGLIVIFLWLLVMVEFGGTM